MDKLVIEAKQFLVESKNIYYTNAPEAYDYEYVKTIKVIGKTKRGDAVRMIDIDTSPYRVDYQIGRYRSLMSNWVTQDFDEAKYFMSV